MTPCHPPRRRLALAALALWGAGCAANDLEGDASPAFDTGLGGEVQDLSRSIRIDVLPAGDAPVLPQSLVFGGEVWTDLALDLAPTMVWSGTVTGFVANPFDITVPGEASVPVDATVEALVVGQRGGAAGGTDRGDFSLRVPASDGYRISIIPEGLGALPFLVVSDFDLSRDRRNDSVDLGAGQPVYGQVRQSDGTTLPKPAQAWLVDALTGVAGPRADLDSSGHFLLRALPGSYAVVVQGRFDSSYLPRLDAAVEVGEDEPVQVDIDAGLVQAVRVDCLLVGANGEPVEDRDVAVRFIAESLDAAAGTASVLVQPIGDGVVFADLLPGTWTLEVTPPFDADGTDSPLRVEGIVVGEADTDIGTFALPGRVPVGGVIRSYADGEPLGDVLVTAREVGFGQNAWSTRSDASGRYALTVPDVALDVTFSPASPQNTTTWQSVTDPRELGDVRLVAGQPVSGVVSFGGEPLSYAVVEVRDGVTGDLYGTSFTDSEGGFAVRIDHQGSLGDIGGQGSDSGGGAADTGAR